MEVIGVVLNFLLLLCVCVTCVPTKSEHVVEETIEDHACSMIEGFASWSN
jgi:hypothetical protein